MVAFPGSQAHQNLVFMGSSQFGKILTVWVLVGTSIFMGFSMVTGIAGPNWTLKSSELSDYAFTRPSGPGATWDVTARDLLQTSVAKPKTLPAAYITALKHKVQKYQGLKTANDQEISSLKKKLSEVELLAKSDTGAIQKRIEFLNAEIRNQNAESKTVADQILAQTSEAQKLNEQIAMRREETDRMRAELEELRSRYSDLSEQKRRLNDLLIRSHGLLERATRRHELIKSDAEGVSENGL